MSSLTILFLVTLVVLVILLLCRKSVVVCPHCGWSPGSVEVTCRSCGEVLKLSHNTSRKCPKCGVVVTHSILCIRCEKEIPLN
ncbi:MAG: hypothetical protein QXR60_02740 [Candidatus Nanoarchaeia archaeon]